MYASFQKTLRTHIGPTVEYFRQTFSTSPRMCICRRFPVYSSKHPDSTSIKPANFPRQFDRFCLKCIDEACSEYSADELYDLWDQAGCEDEFVSFYDTFYPPDCRDRMLFMPSFFSRLQAFEVLAEAMDPLMRKKGKVRTGDCYKCEGVGFEPGLAYCSYCVFRWMKPVGAEQVEKEEERKEEGKQGRIGQGNKTKKKKKMKAKQKGKEGADLAEKQKGEGGGGGGEEGGGGGGDDGDGGKE
jgi:hypothetical protein